MKSQKFEYFCTLPEAVADRGYSNTSGGAENYWLSDVLYCKNSLLKV